VYIGTRPARLPPPFGPAANGVVIYSANGEIFAADPVTGDIRAIITGPEEDLRPIFSPDGTKFAFERVSSGTRDLYVARSDGTALTRVTAEPITLTASNVGDPYQFSPDGRSLVFAGSLGDNPPGLYLAASDGSGVRRLDLSQVADRVTFATEPTFRPPKGDEILFVGTDDNSVNGGAGIYAIDIVSGKTRPIVETDPAHELNLATWSPDGSQLSYGMWDGTADALTVRLHIVGADGSGDRMLPAPSGMAWDLGAAWSNDGTRLLVIRGYTGNWDETRAVIVPTDGSGGSVELSYPGSIQQDCCYAWEWSPDDSMVLGRPIQAGGQPLQQILIDVASGTIREAPWTSTADFAWQRVAR